MKSASSCPTQGYLIPFVVAGVDSLHLLHVSFECGTVALNALRLALVEIPSPSQAVKPVACVP